MTIPTAIRALAVAPVLAAALVGALADSAHARDNFSHALLCEARGYLWVNGQGCADTTCQFFGTTYQPGESVSVRLAGGGYAHYFCDGLTVRMEQIPLQQGTTPRATTPTRR